MRGHYRPDLGELPDNESPEEQFRNMNSPFNLNAEQIKNLHVGKTFQAKGQMWFPVRYYEGHYSIERLQTLCLWTSDLDARKFIAILQHTPISA